MKIAIITDITGQDGAYLSKFLLEKGYNIIGLIRNNSKSNLKNLEYLDIKEKIKFIKVNLLDLPNVFKIIEKKLMRYTQFSCVKY